MNAPAVILARGGSKGLPGKNIKEIKGTPLLAFPILAAKKSKYISDIYVSTDDDSIKEAALKYGAKVIDRPASLATDDSLDIEAMRHVVDHLSSGYDFIVHLRATTPMIESSILDEAIEYFLSNPESTSLRSAHEVPEPPYKFFREKDMYWEGLFDHELSGEYYNLPRQSLPKVYHPNGYVDIVRPEVFMNSDALHGNKMLSFVTDYAYEVDTLIDFKMLEAVYDQN